MRRQDRIGVDGDRVAHRAQQRQVVVGIAVEPAARHVRPAAAVRQQPRFHMRELVFAEARHADDLAGDVAAGIPRRLGGQQVLEVHRVGEGLRHQARGGRHHHAGVAGIAVACHQVVRLGRDAAGDQLREFVQPGLQSLGRVLAQCTDGEAVHRHHVHLAGGVGVAVAEVVLLEGGRQRAALDQEAREDRAAVERDQRVVEVEQRQLHPAIMPDPARSRGWRANSAPRDGQRGADRAAVGAGGDRDRRAGAHARGPDRDVREAGAGRDQHAGRHAGHGRVAAGQRHRHAGGGADRQRGAYAVAARHRRAGERQRAGQRRRCTDVDGDRGGRHRRAHRIGGRQRGLVGTWYRVAVRRIRLGGIAPVTEVPPQAQRGRRTGRDRRCRPS